MKTTPMKPTSQPEHGPDTEPMKPRTTRPARPRPTAEKRLLQLLERGLTLDPAAVLTGIPNETVAAWLRDRPDFAQAVRVAQAKCRGRLEDTILRAAKTDWRAAAWILERRWSQEYGQRLRIEGTLAGTIKQWLASGALGGEPQADADTTPGGSPKSPSRN